jgi:acyl carrier protein
MPSNEQWNWDQFNRLACEILSEILHSPISNLRSPDNLLEHVGLDSFHLLSFTTELESRLEIELPGSLEEPTAGMFYHQTVDALNRPKDEPSIIGPPSL